MSRQTALVDLNSLLEQTTGHYQGALRAKNLSLKTDLSVTELNQDPLLLSFVLDSLVNNSIKYSPVGGQIVLSSKQQGNQVQLSLSDQGPGIPQDKASQLFQPFSRVENVATDFNQQGSGLSLYLDRLILKYLGGDVSLAPTKQGARVEVRVPESMV
jgi:signal transduction histidine kinase